MKKFAFTALIMLLAMVYSYAQADKIVGYWLTENDKSQIHLFKSKDNKYYGKMVWLKAPNRDDGTPKIDDKNPNKKLQNEPLIGLLIVKGLVYNEKEKEWSGTVYDPENGETYDCYAWFDGNDNVLMFKGYVMGIKWLGRETSWKRSEKK